MGMLQGDQRGYINSSIADAYNARQAENQPRPMTHSHHEPDGEPTLVGKVVADIRRFFFSAPA